MTESRRRISALYENPVHVKGGSPEQVGQVDAIRHESASRHVVPALVYGRQTILGGKVDDLARVTVEQRIAGRDDRIRHSPHRCGECAFEFIRIAYWNRDQLQAQDWNGGNQLLQVNKIGGHLEK